MNRIKRIIARAKRKKITSSKRTVSKRVLKSSGKSSRRRSSQKRSKRIKADVEEESITRAFSNSLNKDVIIEDKTPFKNGYIYYDELDNKWFVFDESYKAEDEVTQIIADDINIYSHLFNVENIIEFSDITDLDALADDLTNWYMNNDIDLEFPVASSDYDDVYKEMYAFLDQEDVQFLVDLKDLDVETILDHDYISTDLEGLASDIIGTDGIAYCLDATEENIIDPETDIEYIAYLINN